ncbi:MAG: NAD(P)-dependent alcohol dehydrogenase [Actinomycetota bacterium]|nr:NAD(P)-dependent alcohol dehydrogenase [Actinomycetota bacterium]
MRAVVQDRYGPPEVLRTETIERPSIGPGDVLVEVRAAGVDRGTLHLLTGLPYLMRIMGFGFRRPKNRVPGLDVAGVVAAVGASVTRFSVGDEVCGIARGSFAHYAAAAEDKLSHKPATVGFAEAAAMPVSGLTAVQALRGVQAGDRVLVTGASGGVGSYAVQVAKVMGAEVTGECSTAKVDLVRSLGADRVLDHTRDDFAAEPARYDVIVDTGGRPSLRRLRRALTRQGRAVIVGGENGGRWTGGRWTGGFGRQVRAMALSPFVPQTLIALTSTEHHADIDRLVELVDAGAVVPALDRTYPLNQVGDALAHLASGTVRGKLVVVP